MKKVISIVGCGFIGSHLAEELPKLFFSQDLFPYTFRFIDFDKWEDRNAANQNVHLSVAKEEEFKAVTCSAIAGHYNNDSEFITEKLTPANAMELLKDSVLIIDAVDNIPTRQILWGLGKSGVLAPVMHTGISRKGDGMVNWSSKNFDTFPFKPANVAGRDMKEQDFKEPPCEMYKYRANGMVLFQAIAKATAFFFGKDPWETVGGHAESGMMTCWTTSENGMEMQVDDMFLDGDFFPINVSE